MSLQREWLLCREHLHQEGKLAVEAPAKLGAERALAIRLDEVDERGTRARVLDLRRGAGVGAEP